MRSLCPATILSSLACQHTELRAPASAAAGAGSLTSNPNQAEDAQHKETGAMTCSLPDDKAAAAGVAEPQMRPNKKQRCSLSDSTATTRAAASTLQQSQPTSCTKQQLQRQVLASLPSQQLHHAYTPGHMPSLITTS